MRWEKENEINEYLKIRKIRQRGRSGGYKRERGEG